MADTPTYNFLLQLCSFVSHGFLASHLQQTDVNKVRLHVASHMCLNWSFDSGKLREEAKHCKQIEIRE